MQLPADVRLLYAASGAVLLALTSTLLLARREFRTVRGLGRISAGFCFFLVAVFLFSLQDETIPLLSVLLPNLCAILGAALLLEGNRENHSLGDSRDLTLAALGVSTPLFLVFIWVFPSSNATTITRSLIMAVFLSGAALTTWRHRRRPGLDALGSAAAIALGATSLILGTRGVALLGGLGSGEPKGTLTGAAILVATFTAVLWTASFLATANRRLTTQIRRQKDLFSNLLLMARAAGTKPALESALAETLQLACSLTGATGSSLILVDEQGEFKNGLYSSLEMVEPLPTEMGRGLLAKGLAGWVARERTTALLPKVEADPRWHIFPGHQAGHTRSALCVPIVSGSQLAGVLGLIHQEPAWFDDEHRRLIESAAAQIALVLRNIQISDGHLRVLQERTLLNRVLEISARLTDADLIATETADAIAAGTHWYPVTVALQGDDGYFRFHGQDSGLLRVQLALERGVIGRAFRSGEIQLVEDVSKDPDYTPIVQGVTSEIAAPLVHNDRVLGVLNIETKDPWRLDSEDVPLALSLAEAIGLGIEKVRLNQVKQELTSTLVHDLRAPMVSIMGALEMLGESRRLDELEREFVDIAQRNASRQADLIDAILEISRLEDGKLPINRGSFSIGELVEDALTLAKPRAQNRNIELLANVAPQLPNAWIDRSLISRVLENLIANAIKFSEPGSGPVLVEAVQAGASFAEIRVVDSGPGIEDQVRMKLFRRFAPGKHSAGGTGLGLSFCRLAVEANEGRIWLDRSNEEGARFVFTVPLELP